MKRKADKKDKIIITIGIILTISIVFNIYQGVISLRYKNIIEQQCYDDIEVIRVKNESILSQLESCITAKSITTTELLSLYQTYKDAVDTEVELWEYYFQYKNNPYIKTQNKNGDLEDQNKYQLYWKAEELFYTYIEKNLDANESSITLSNEQLSDFMVLRDIANNINQYYIEFYNKKCKDVKEEQKAKIIINNSYWIDILKGIEEITGKYVDYQFTYEVN